MSERESRLCRRRGDESHSEWQLETPYVVSYN